MNSRSFGAASSLLAASVLAAPADAAIVLPINETVHIEYFASLAYAGPRIRDCSPGLLPGPTTDKHNYGLFFARWTGARPLYHGATNSAFKPKDIRLPAFFATERYYAEMHATAHAHFPTKITASDYTANTPANYDPALLSYDFAQSGNEADILYGYEFWPEKFAAALGVSVDPNAADRSKWTADNQSWAAHAGQQSGVAGFSKQAPENVVASRWMSDRLSALLKVPIRATIARRAFPTDAAALVAKAQILNQIPELKNAPGEPISVADPTNLGLLGLIESGDASLQALARYFNPNLTNPKPVRMSYDEVVVFADKTPLKYKKTEKLAADMSGVLDLLGRWLKDRCDKAPPTTLSYGLDYRTFIPFPDGSLQQADKTAVRTAAAQGLLPAAAADPKQHAAELREDLWTYNDELLTTTTSRLDSLGIAYNKKLTTRLLTDISKLTFKSSSKTLTPAELSSLRTNAAQMLGIFCSSPKAPITQCMPGDLDLAP